MEYLFAKKYRGKRALRVKARIHVSWQAELKRRQERGEEIDEILYTKPYFMGLIIEKGLEFFENQNGIVSPQGEENTETGTLP